MKATINRLMSHISRAYKYACEDPEISLIYSRKATEDICRKIFENNIGKPGKLMLEQMIGKIAGTGEVPAFIVAHLKSIQAYGNYAAHSQVDIDCEKHNAMPCLLALNSIINWFFNDYAETDVPESILALISGPLSNTTESPAPAPREEFLILPGSEPRLLRWRFAEKSDFSSVSEIANFYLGNGHGISTNTITDWHHVNCEM